MSGRMLALLGTVLASIAAAAPSATAAPLILSDAAQTTAACVERSHALLVDMQIDRSGSLAGTDPQNRRVDGVKAALMGLALLADDRADAQRVNVEVLLSSFAGTVEPDAQTAAKRWLPLTTDSLDDLMSEADGYAHRKHVHDTDYVLALTSARAALDARAKVLAEADGRAPCKIVLFVSDGRFHLSDPPGEPGGGARAVAQGRIALCKPNGVMDQIVEDGIGMFTVALSASRHFTAEQRAFLGALTVGHTADQRCGVLPSPATGAFFDVHDNLDLFLVFGNLLVHAPVQPPIAVCQGGLCKEGTRTFYATPGLRGFVLAASAPLPGLQLTLVGPNGKSTTLPSAGTTRHVTSGTEVVQRWIQSRSLGVQARFQSASKDWIGPWRYAFIEPSGEILPPPAYTLRLQSDLRPALVTQPQMTPGRTTAIRVQLVDHRGRAVRHGELARSAHIRAWVTDATGITRRRSITKRSDGTYAVRVHVPKRAPEGRWTMDLESSFALENASVDPVRASLALDGVHYPTHFPWLAVLVGVATAVALALALLYRHRRRRALFTPPQQLHACACRAVVTPGEAVALEPEPMPTGEEFAPLTLNGRDAGVRRIAYDGFELRARVGSLFTGQARGEATADRLQLIGGTTGGALSVRDAHRVCTVPLELSGSWLFAVEQIDEHGTVHGRLILFSGEDELPGHAASVVSAARARLRTQAWDGFETGPGPAADDDDWATDDDWALDDDWADVP